MHTGQTPRGAHALFGCQEAGQASPKYAQLKSLFALAILDASHLPHPYVLPLGLPFSVGKRKETFAKHWTGGNGVQSRQMVNGESGVDPRCGFHGS